jgi:hypothetical protein
LINSFIIWFYLRRQKESRENLIQSEVERRVKDIVETRVREELERRKDEIENEVKRRVDVLKRSMEKQMLTELEKRNNDEVKKLIAKEVRYYHHVYFYINGFVF